MKHNNQSNGSGFCSCLNRILLYKLQRDSYSEHKVKPRNISLSRIMSNNLLVVPVSPELCIRVQGGNHQRKITFEPRLNHKPMGGGFRRKACGQVGCVVEEAVCGGRRLERRRQSSRAKDLASVEDAVITNRIDRQLINSSFGAAIVQCLCCYALVLFPRKNGASEYKEKSSWISI